MAAEVKDLVIGLAAEGTSLLKGLSGVPGVEKVVGALIEFSITQTHKIRFRRFMNSIAFSMGDGKELTTEDKVELFTWINQDERTQGYFHDSMRTSLHSNSRISQAVIGLLVAESYKDHNISYETSVLYRAFDAVDDFELKLFIEYLDIYTTHLKAGELLIVTEKNITSLAEKRHEDREITKSRLMFTLEFLISKRIFEHRTMVWDGYNSLCKVAPINNVTLKAIDLIRKAIDIQDQLV